MTDYAQTRKNAAVQFLKLVVAGRIDEAYEMHVDMRGKHHNLYSPEGFPALQKAMMENHIQFPNKKLTVKNLLADGELVVVHSQLVLHPGEKGTAVVHVFRFEGDRIVELWDIGQSVPDDSPNKDGAF
jgi:predicted SnoaL-like aldol condensation-catalyzing enzyme